MHYKRSIIGVLKDIAPTPDWDEGRRRTLVEAVSYTHLRTQV